MSNQRVTVYYDDDLHSEIHEFVLSLPRNRRSEILRNVLALGIEARRSGAVLRSDTGPTGVTVDNTMQSSGNSDTNRLSRDIDSEGISNRLVNQSTEEEDFIIGDAGGQNPTSASAKDESLSPKRVFHRFNPTPDRPRD